MKRSIWILVIVLGLLLSACGGQPAAPAEIGAAPTTQAAPADTQAPLPPTEVAPTAAPTEAGPQVGGTVVIELLADPTTLDPQQTNSGGVVQYLGSSLVSMDPDTGEYVPYLAESWTVSEDGMYWEFKLRQDVKFHNGAPLTAQDFVYTIQRAQNPETMSPVLGVILQGVAGAEALDDYTLRINMAFPNFSLLNNISKSAYLQPLPQAYLEEVGPDAFGRAPVGVGPYKIKEWVTGDKVVMERNPDFTWGPAFTHGGAPYIETLEFRVIPEYATMLAGMEAGEIDYASIQDQDVQRIRDTGQMQVSTFVVQGSLYSILFNVSQPPFDDIRVRKAFNLAVDREAMIRLCENGEAEVNYGPMSSSIIGYWPGVEEIGYRFDLAQAKALMQEVGYTFNADGWLEKDGQVFQVSLIAYPDPTSIQQASILKEQYKALGVDLQIEQLDPGVIYEKMSSGDFSMELAGFGWDEGTSLMFAMFHSSMIGALNYSRIADPELDTMLAAAMHSVTSEDNLAALADAQRYVVENAYTVPLYAPNNYVAIRSSIVGWKINPGLWDYPFDAYIATP